MNTVALLLTYLVITPLFGKFIDWREAIVFYSVPLLISYRSRQQTCKLHPHFIVTQSILVLLFILSTVFSKNIGTSCYSLIYFLTVLLTLNLSLKLVTNIDLLLKTIIFGSILYASIFYIYKIFSIPDYSLGQDDIFIQFWGHSYIADFLVLGVPIIVSRFNTANKPKNIFILLYLLLAILVTNSRSSLFALTVGTLFLKTDFKFGRIIKIFTILTLVFSLIFVFFKHDYHKTSDGSRPEYWRQAITAFKKAPLLGYGAGNFTTINRLFRTSASNYTSFAHSSFFEYLSGNGVIFTGLFFLTILVGLYFQSKTNNLLFTLGVVSLINSLLDPSWSSPGIFALGLFFIFYYKKTPTHHQYSKMFVSFLFTTILLFFILTTASNILIAGGNNRLGYLLNPLNPDVIDTTKDLSVLNRTLSLYRHDTSAFYSLVHEPPSPQNEQYYLKIINLDPYNSSEQSTLLMSHYSKTEQWAKLTNLTETALPYLNQNNLTNIQSTNVALSLYHLAVYQWHNNQFNESVSSFEKAVPFAYNWSHFHIELANAYWHNQQPQKAIDQLEKICTQYLQSKPHCLEYLQKYRSSFPYPWVFNTGIDKLFSTFLSPPALQKQLF